MGGELAWVDDDSVTAGTRIIHHEKHTRITQNSKAFNRTLKERRGKLIIGSGFRGPPNQSTLYKESIK